MSTLDWRDTIVAVASPPGGGWEGILRLAGEQCPAVLSQVFRPSAAASLPTRGPPRAWPGELALGEDWPSAPALLYFWPGARSYTKQPAAELRLPGSPQLLERALAALVRGGARLARPGEFTLRAFLAGRLDLTQAEAVLGVIDARDAAQLATALAQLSGGLAAPLGELRRKLLDLLAEIEAGLDFVDEDLDFAPREAVLATLAAALAETTAILGKLSARSAGAERPRVVLLGQPNAGKSRLFNALAGAEAALVSPQAGATRDYLSAEAALAGVTVRLLDTAGVNEALSSAAAAREVEQAAQAKTASQQQQAELILLCLDEKQPRLRWEHELMHQAAGPAPLGAPQVLVVYTKADLHPPLARTAPARRVSSATGEGLAELQTAIAAALSERWGEATPSTASRCRESLVRTQEALGRAVEVARQDFGDELLAGELRLALEELGLVVGAVVTSDLLDRIFSKFCIGK